MLLRKVRPDSGDRVHMQAGMAVASMDTFIGCIVDFHTIFGAVPIFGIIPYATVYFSASVKIVRYLLMAFRVKIYGCFSVFWDSSAPVRRSLSGFKKRFSDSCRICRTVLNR